MLVFSKRMRDKHVYFRQRAMQTALHIRDVLPSDGDIGIVNTGERPLSPSGWQATCLVVTSTEDKVRKQMPQQIFWGEGERPLLWENSVQDLSKSHRNLTNLALLTLGGYPTEILGRFFRDVFSRLPFRVLMK